MKNIKSKKDPFIKAVAETLREIRLEKGYTNYEYLAYELKIPRTQYGRYEQGNDMRLTSLKRVLDGIEVSTVEFFERVEKRMK